MLDRREAVRASRGRVGPVVVVGDVVGDADAWASARGRRCGVAAAAAAPRTTAAAARPPLARTTVGRGRRRSAMVEADHDQRRARQASRRWSPPASEPTITPNASIPITAIAVARGPGRANPNAWRSLVLLRERVRERRPRRQARARSLLVDRADQPRDLRRAAARAGPRTPRSSAGRGPAVCRIPHIGACCAARWPWDPKCSSPARQCRLRTVRRCEHLETERSRLDPRRLAGDRSRLVHNSRRSRVRYYAAGERWRRPRPPNGHTSTETNRWRLIWRAARATRAQGLGARRCPDPRAARCPHHRVGGPMRRVRSAARARSALLRGVRGAPRPVEVSRRPARAPRSGRVGLAPKAAPRGPRVSAGTTLVAGVGVLLLAIGLGVLIGRTSNKNPTAAASSPCGTVVTVQGGGGGGSGTTAASTPTTTSAACEHAEGLEREAEEGRGADRAAVRRGAEEGQRRPPARSSATRRTWLRPRSQPGGPVRGGAGCQGGKFTGNFFGN